MIYLVSSNQNKFRELQELLPVPLELVDLELSELQTTNLRALIENKLKQAYHKIQNPVIVEDTSLFFNVWNELPGPLIKWFTKNMGLEGLVTALSSFQDKSAYAVCCLGYTQDGENFHFFEGRIHGEIVFPRGIQGFGWDRIFVPEGTSQTFAEMSTTEKHQISMRKRAAMPFKHFLAQQEEQR
ncbi:non-canonical purine NTP pyrophosphatase [Deltaproteobacteria bacterium TL4]